MALTIRRKQGYLFEDANKKHDDKGTHETQYC